MIGVSSHTPSIPIDSRRGFLGGILEGCSDNLLPTVRMGPPLPLNPPLTLPGGGSLHHPASPSPPKMPDGRNQNMGGPFRLQYPMSLRCKVQSHGLVPRPLPIAAKVLIVQTQNWYLILSTDSALHPEINPIELTQAGTYHQWLTL